MPVGVEHATSPWQSALSFSLALTDVKVQESKERQLPRWMKSLLLLSVEIRTEGADQNTAHIDPILMEEFT